MNNNRLFIITWILIIILTACSPSQQVVGTAIAQTQAAIPTLISSPTPYPTYTFYPTQTFLRPDVSWERIQEVLEKNDFTNMTDLFSSNSPGDRYYNSAYGIGVDIYKDYYLDIAVSISGSGKWSTILDTVISEIYGTDISGWLEEHVVASEQVPQGSIIDNWMVYINTEDFGGFSVLRIVLLPISN